MKLPRLYVILDRATLDTRGIGVAAFASELRDAGVTLLQYRDKVGGPQQVLRAAAEIIDVFAGVNATLILNDRADLGLLAGFTGVHVGQGDLPVEAVRTVLGRVGIAGVSTHNDDQVRVADAGSADYLAIGPVFATSSKLNAEPAVRLEGVSRARPLTTKPLIAIGGITLENARSVIDAGADSVAVISGLFVPGRCAGDVARDFLERLR